MSKKRRTETEKRLEYMIWRLARRVGKAHRLLTEYVRETKIDFADVPDDADHTLWWVDWLERVQRFLREDMVKRNE